MQTTSRIRPFLIIFAAVFLLSAHKALGFRPSPHTTYFKVTDMQSGLPDNCVNDITEDPYGFIWVATWNGIARFDGKNVEVFRHDESPDMPGINMARALLADTDGIWICEDGGVSFLRFADNQFIEGKYTAEGKSPTRISRRVSHIIRQGDNVVIQSSDGELMSLDRNATDIAKGKITFRRVAKPSDRFYTDIVPFSGGRTMAVSNDGITVLSGDAAKELCHTRIEGLTYDNNLNLFCDLVNGRVYVGCGIGEKSHAYKILSSKGDVREISDVHVPDGLMETAQIGATVYFATDGYGLQVLNPDGSTISYSPGNSSLPCDALYTIHADRNGNIWCGSYRHGICMLSKELNSYTVRSVDTGTLSYNIVTSIVKDGHTLYLGLDGGGIDIYNTATDTSVNLNTDNSALPGNNVVSLVKDPSTLWAATYSDGLAEIDLNSRSIRTHAMPDSGDGNDKLWVIVDDGNGNLWAGGGSLYVFNKASKTFSRVSGCENLTIMSIINDGDSMWVATRLNGVLKINKKTRKMTARFSNSPTAGGGILPGKQAEYLYIDSRRNLWININNKDLCVVNADKGGKAKIYNSHNGLINNVVNAIVEDAKGDLWIGTNDGLYKYIRANDSFVKKKDSRIPTTFIHSAAATAGDVAYFGTTAGVLDFRMTDPPSLGRSMPVVFTSLNILDNEKTSLSLYSQENPEVKLEHSQNFFTVRFSVPEMSNPDQLQFECRLEGLEDVWQDASTTRSVTYTNVPAGDYFLLVRHTNPDGSWSEPSRMAIHVKSPWYASTSMLLVWAALALLFTYFIARMRHKFDINKKKTERAELERDSAKKLNEAKLDFYATISHELRTPCFLISAQIEEIMDSDRQTVPVSTLTGIYRNSNKLNKLINHIIDFRKNDNGLLKLNPRKVELVKFLENLTYDYEQLCRQKSLTFSYVHDAPPIEARVDSDKIEQIVTNLISNAYKYTPKGGSVTLSLRLLDDTAPGNSADPASGNKTVEISVSDTGIGIMEKLQDKIFKPFFRTERGEAQSYGDGIGLAFVRELVELHGGTIALDSKINEGSTFIVTIPLDARHNSENSVAITNSKTAAMADFNDTDAFADIDNTPPISNNSCI